MQLHGGAIDAPHQLLTCLGTKKYPKRTELHQVAAGFVFLLTGDQDSECSVKLLS